MDSDAHLEILLKAQGRNPDRRAAGWPIHVVLKPPLYLARG
jgi:hypothetical protein